MSYPYDPNQNPRSGASGPAGAGQGYGQGQGYDEEEAQAYPPQAGYPDQGYVQPGYQGQGAYTPSTPSGQPGRAYTPQYAQSVNAAAPPQTGGRNWLPYLVVGVVLVALACCVLPGAVLVRNGVINLSSTTTSATPAPGTAVYQSTLLISDDRWPSTTTCSFKSSGYAITDNDACIARISSPNDLSISTAVMQTSGPTGLPHGIALRRTSANDYYVFGITSAGSWVFVKYADNKTPQALVPFKTSTAIKSGLNATNTIEVRAQGSQFYFFVNGTAVGQASDTAYTSGLPGLTGDSGATVVYTNVKISKLAGA